MPDPTADIDTLELAAAGADRVLGPDHGVTQALARARAGPGWPRGAPEGRIAL